MTQPPRAVDGVNKICENPVAGGAAADVGCGPPGVGTALIHRGSGGAQNGQTGRGVDDVALSFTVEPGTLETVVRARGDVDTAAAAALDEQLTHAADYGTTVVVDLSEVRTLDPIGLSVLYRAQSRCRALKGDLVLVVPQLPLLRLLQAAGLADVFDVRLTCPPLRAGVAPA